MAKLIWDKVGERIYETGDKNVALYPYMDEAGTLTVDGHTYTTHYTQGVAWNGITAMTESPSGAEANDLWADDTKYATMRSAEQFGGTIEAYTYPDEWEQCDGSATVNGVTIGQQSRKSFGLAYVTTVGNDVKLNDYGEKIHLIYGATASPSERSYATINDSPDAITFSWEYETTPVEVGTIDGVEYKKVSCLTLDENKIVTGATPEAIAARRALWNSFKNIIFGKDNTAAVGEDSNEITPTLLMPPDVIAFFQ